MPRQMPRFDLRFQAEAQIANEIVQAGEQSRIHGNWTPKRLEFLYELAYLRVFATWEATLESIFLRSLCGYASRAGRETMVSGTYYPTIPAAEAAVLAGAGHTFLLWHNTQRVIARCKGYIKSGAGCGPALQETTIASNQARLDALAAIRHRIVHDQNDSKVKFDNATLLLAGRTYAASRPGKFLRDDLPGLSPPRTWLDVMVSELTGLAGQMV